MKRCSRKCNAKAQDLKRNGRAHELHAPAEGHCDVCRGLIPLEGWASEPTGSFWPPAPARGARGPGPRSTGALSSAGAPAGKPEAPASATLAAPTNKTTPPAPKHLTPPEARAGGVVPLSDRDVVRLAVATGQVVAMLLGQPASAELLERWALIGLQRLRQAEHPWRPGRSPRAEGP